VLSTTWTSISGASSLAGLDGSPSAAAGFGGSAAGFAGSGSGLGGGGASDRANHPSSIMALSSVVVRRFLLFGGLASSEDTGETMVTAGVRPSATGGAADFVPWGPTVIAPDFPGAGLGPVATPAAGMPTTVRRVSGTGGA